MQRKVLGLAAICAVLVVLGALPAWAHHSHNAYEVTMWTTIEGTVTEIHYLLSPFLRIPMGPVASSAHVVASPPFGSLTSM